MVASSCGSVREKEENKGKSPLPTLVEDASRGDDSNSEKPFDYYTLSETVRASFFERYSEEKVGVPSEVLYFSSAITDLAAARKARSFCLPKPYFFRAPGP